MFHHKTIFCGPSLEPSHQDGSNKESQRMFSLRNKQKNIFLLSLIPLLSRGLPFTTVILKPEQVECYYFSVFKNC